MDEHGEGDLQISACVRRFPLIQPAVLALPNRKITLKKPFQLLLVLLGCLHLAGGPYSMIQVYAWAGMLVSYSQDGGIINAARDTFSGEKPCGLCSKIAAAREVDQKSGQPLVPLSSSLSAKQLAEMIPATVIRLRFPRPCELPPVQFTGVFSSHGMACATPPTPPPRLVV